MKRKPLIILGIVVAVIILLAVVPLFINVDQFRPQVEAQLKAALGRNVKIGKLSLSAFFSHVTAETLTIADDPAFSKDPFITARSIEVNASLLPLLTGQGLQVSSITLVEPQVTLLHSPAGKWNFSSLGASDKAGAKSGGSVPNVSVGELDIKNGTIYVGRLGTKTKNRAYTDVNVNAKNVSMTTKMPFTVSAKTPGGGDLRVEGTAGALNRDDAAKTPLDAKVTLKHVDLANTGFLDPNSGIAGSVDFDGTVKSDGEKAHSEGKATVQHVKLVRGGAPAKMPVGLEYATDLDLAKQAGEMSKGLIHAGSTTAKLGGTFDLKPETPTVKLKLTGQGMPVNEIQGLLPAVGVVLPPGSSLQGGTANANLDLDGPIDRLVTTGTVNVNNTRLTNFNLGSKIQAPAALAGVKTGDNTDIQLMACRLRVAPDGIRTEDLNLVMPTLGTATGSGTISPSNALHYDLTVKLAQGSPLAALTNLTSLGRSSGGTIPMTITGTTSNPIILPNVKGMLNPLGGLMGGQQQQGGQQQPQQNPFGAIGGLFQKKKK
jgi:AsmA protein